MVTGYSLIDGGFKTNAATFFITFKDFKQRYASIATAKEQNARAILTRFYDEAKHIEQAVVLPIAPPAIPGIGTTGGFEFWIQDTAAGSPVELGEQTQAFLAKARARPELSGPEHHLQRQHAAAARQRRPRQDDAAGRADPGRVQRDPGAVRLAHGQPVQPVQPRLVGDHAVRRAVPPAAGRPDTAVHALEPEQQDGAAVGAGRRPAGPRGRTSCRTSTASRRPRSSATPRRATARGRRSRRWRTSRANCRRATASPGRAWPSRRSSPAAPRRWPSCSA